MCFLSQNFEKRVYGLQQITSEIQSQIFSLKRQKQLKKEKKDSDEVKVAEFLLKWLQDNKIFKYVVGEYKNSELLKISGPLFIFLKLYNEIDIAQIQNIIQFIAKEHDTLKQAMYTILADMISYLTLTEVEEIFKMLKDNDDLKSDIQYINVLKQLAINNSVVSTQYTKNANVPQKPQPETSSQAGQLCKTGIREPEIQVTRPLEDSKREAEECKE